jgi:hypothetical protein
MIRRGLKWKRTCTKVKGSRKRKGRKAKEICTGNLKMRYQKKKEEAPA